MLFEILSEEGLRTEIEVVGDLLNTHARIFQQRLRFEDDRFVDPLGRCEVLFDQFMQLLGEYNKFLLRKGFR